MLALLRHCTEVEKLSLSGLSEIDDDAATAIMQQLGRANRVRCLDISDNDVSAAVVPAICKSLPSLEDFSAICKRTVF